MTKPVMQERAAEYALAKHEPSAPVPMSESAALMSMIERAARDPSIDLDRMERLYTMHERAEARRAKASFDSALAEMQPKLPVVQERGKIDIGRGKPQSYALWEDINEAIKPVLAEYGFAISFRTGREEAQIIVTGILSHRDGHREETTMRLPLDQSGSKNAVQAVGSSTSYGKRYAASALLNLTSRGEDDDGKGGGGAPISDEQLQALRDLIETAEADEARFCKHFGIKTLPELPGSRYDEAQRALGAKLQKKGPRQ